MKGKAFFDFDGTLITRDSLLPFIIYVVGWPVFIVKSLILLPILVRYGLGLATNSAVKKSALTLYFKDYPEAKMAIKAVGFVDEVLPKLIKDPGMEKLAWHQAAGHDCILVSASIDLYLKIWAKKNGFVDLICTPYVGAPKMMGINCYGEEKVKCIAALYPDLDQYETFAYGDTVGDIPMLTLVDNGYMWCSAKKAFVTYIPLTNEDLR